MSIVNNMTFEEAMATLEALVKKMEDGGLSLDETLASYEEAMALVRYCNTRIEDAEQRIRLLVTGEDGSVTDRPFDGDEA